MKKYNGNEKTNVSYFLISFLESQLFNVNKTIQ